MPKITNQFNADQLSFLAARGIHLNIGEYTDDELMDIHEKITDLYLTESFDKNGNANSKAKIYEQIIDTFYDEFDI